MRIENIIKHLKKDGMKVYVGQFDFKEFWMCNGTALVDLVDGAALPTTAKYSDVVRQIEEGKSHIYTIKDNKKILNANLKWQG